MYNSNLTDVFASARRLKPRLLIRSNDFKATLLVLGRFIIYHKYLINIDMKQYFALGRMIIWHSPIFYTPACGNTDCC